MAYDFPNMTINELAAAMNAPTGDTYMRRIATEALRKATEYKLLLEQNERVERGTFGWVLEGMQESGKSYRRTGWNGNGMFILLVPGSENLTVGEGRPLAEAGVRLGTPFNYLPHIDMWTAQGDVTAWTPSQADMLATDWEVV